MFYLLTYFLNEYLSFFFFRTLYFPFFFPSWPILSSIYLHLRKKKEYTEVKVFLQSMAEAYFIRKSKRVSPMNSWFRLRISPAISEYADDQYP